MENNPILISKSASLNHFVKENSLFDAMNKGMRLIFVEGARGLKEGTVRTKWKKSHPYQRSVSMGRGRAIAFYAMLLVR